MHAGPIHTVHTLILGAGAAGLTAAYRLAASGIRPVVLERDTTAGGLMRGLKRGAFHLDIGRKELYNRLPRVDAFWAEILGDDYRAYAHRVGILYDGQVLEKTRHARGWRRGLPVPLAIAGWVDLIGSRIRYGRGEPRNFQEYHYRRSGRLLSRIFQQGYQEKFAGVRWADLPPPRRTRAGDAGEPDRVGHRAERSREARESRQWRHPARGTGQICEWLEQRGCALGAQFHFGARIIGMAGSDGKITEVTAEVNQEVATYRPQHVVGGLPPEALAKMLGPAQHVVRPPAEGTGPIGPSTPRRSTVLVYLFLDEPPRFPHAWLEVTSPDLRAGRIVNYAGFNGEMVPKGKTCLCVEYFCTGDDPLLQLDAARLCDLGLDELTRARLVTRSSCFDAMALTLPGADAATSWREWRTDERASMLRGLGRFDNLYFVNRPGMDRATLAGLEAADAITTGDRSRFSMPAIDDDDSAPA